MLSLISLKKKKKSAPDFYGCCSWQVDGCFSGEEFYVVMRNVYMRNVYMRNVYMRNVYEDCLSEECLSDECLSDECLSDECLSEECFLWWIFIRGVIEGCLSERCLSEGSSPDVHGSCCNSWQVGECLSGEAGGRVLLKPCAKIFFFGHLRNRFKICHFGFHTRVGIIWFDIEGLKIMLQ